MKSKKILIVDDEEEVRSMFGKFLERKGYRTETAEHALEGVRAFNREKPDLVLTDYHMPQMSGLDLLRELHQIDSNVPVVLMSGVADMRVAVEAIKEHAFDFLSKPIDSSELLGVIQTAIARAEEAAAEAIEKDRSAKQQGKLVGPIYARFSSDYPEILIVQFNRPLDQYTVDSYGAAMDRLDVEHHHPRKMIILLKDVTYINNVGLNFLLDRHARWQNEKRQVVLAAPPHAVARYLDTLGYLRYFPVLTTFHEAIDHMV